MYIVVPRVVVVVVVPALLELELLVPALVLVELELELGLKATVVIVPRLFECVVSCKAVVPLELMMMSLSCLVVSGIVVSGLRSSVGVNDVKSGLVSEIFIWVNLQQL